MSSTVRIGSSSLFEYNMMYLSSTWYAPDLVLLHMLVYIVLIFSSNATLAKSNPYSLVNTSQAFNVFTTKSIIYCFTFMFSIF